MPTGPAGNSGSSSNSGSLASGGGGGGNKVQPRLEINLLMTGPAYAKQRDLFLWALRRQQDRPHADPRSFYQLMGVHGVPFQPYRGLAPPGPPCNSTLQWCGYCHHGDHLFPTFHRAYLLFLEQHLQPEAAAAARAYARVLPGQARAWRRAAAALRVPYWDFASGAAARAGIPPFFDEITVLSMRTGKPTNISNPLRQYRFPLPTGLPADDFPRFSPRGTLTLRWPQAAASGSAMRSNTSALNASVLAHSGGAWREGVRQLLAEPDWHCFSNHEAPLREPQRCRALSSLEFVHDLLHRGLGGPSGHLAHTSIAAFDPLFTLLHASMDRLLAMWQLAHPHDWVSSGVAGGGTLAVPRGSKVR
ncbi:hypothetical protein CHLNCDRAFT_143609 [Chlorella variabilis]|uniref:Tyrosinase copper-binding domain-containing protein n=1 Tax=Chlorella variabilis TaxID=554065 RepID=E1ZA37_CHLVA|nr:hypothetical protein CHLNCDRAFT_143609 [Chlorella variabilis]EFN57197.1 hypothetical protein CHLNCDRAFT_143609 [Chlorella variabilis]|eukprot:XP_005849299.1 hypothetical protein CHLNCDRAFT_143609 [Chlorella variabilis]